jgi:predicted ATP-grasp superfamily ATP-dependent carboligase
VQVIGDLNPKTQVLVAGLWVNGSAVLRNLAGKGYQVCGISHDIGEMGIRSRHGSKVICPDPNTDLDDWVGALAWVAEQCEEKPVFIPTTDRYVVALDRAASELQDKLRYHGFGNGLRTSLTSKRSTFELAEKYQLAMPATIFVETGQQLRHFWRQLKAPVLIKPEFSMDWRTPAAWSTIGRSKAIIAESEQELIDLYDRIKPVTERLIAQEVIPGPDTNLIYWAGFMSDDGHVRGRFVGQKIRVRPIHLGSASFVRLVDMPEVEQQCEDFLRKLEYQGICGIELKLDARDGIAKLVEVNPRYGLWEDIGLPAGVDFAEEAVLSAFGQDTPPHRVQEFRQKWVHFKRDLAAYLEYRGEKSLSLYQWLGSLGPPIIVCDLPIVSDWPVARHNLGSMFRLAFKGATPEP